MRELLKDVEEILNNTGGFSYFLGVTKKPIGGTNGKASQAYLAKEIVSQLSPEDDWRVSELTKLKTELYQQKNKTIDIYSIKPFGDGTISISKDTLKKLAKTSNITVNPHILPKNTFLKLQENLTSLQIEYQDKRTLSKILENAKQLKDWRNSWKELDFQSQEHFETIAQMPMMLISSNICHSQKVHFLVDEYQIEQLAYNQIRNVNLDSETPCVVISTPRINFGYSDKSVINEQKLIRSGLAKICLSNMWENILESSILQRCKYISIPPIGLGASAGQFPDAVAEIYFRTLFELLSKQKYKDTFEGIFYNTKLKHYKQCEDILKDYNNRIDCPVSIHLKDAKFLAANMAKQGYECAVINPSDMDVVLGLHDVGKYYKLGDYAMEEDLASTSTSFLGSAGISGAYQDENRIQNSVGFGDFQNTMKKIQKNFLLDKTSLDITSGNKQFTPRSDKKWLNTTHQKMNSS